MYMWTGQIKTWITLTMKHCGCPGLKENGRNMCQVTMIDTSKSVSIYAN